MVGIQEFYDGRSILITGATGFMGKVLIEKLLRSCPEIARLYLLIRPSSGKDVQLRLHELINCQVFEWLRQNRPQVFEKLVPISGDVCLPDLGLKTKNTPKEMYANVSIVFHLAARVKFDDDLRGAIEMNVKGPKRVAVFCRQLPNLEALVHVSTTFIHLDKQEIGEQIYPTTINPQSLIDVIDSLDDQMLSSISKQLVGKSPNVYAYTKALGETLVQSECETHGIPLVIVRPSSVTAAMKEPFPGWIEKLYGTSGVGAGISKGIIKTLRIKGEFVTDLIPVDLPINLMVAAAWDTATDKTLLDKLRVYNCCSGVLNPITWKEFLELALRSFEKFPCKQIVWPPGVSETASSLIYKIHIVIYHYLPGLFFDTLAVVCGKKPFMLRLYKNVHKALDCLEFYSVNEWCFVSQNIGRLMDKMTPRDQEIFNFDVRQIDWESYIDTYACGVRQHLLRDDMSTLSAAKKNLKRMKRIRALVRLVLVGLFFVFLYILSLTWLDLFQAGYNISQAIGNVTPKMVEPNLIEAQIVARNLIHDTL